MAVISILLPIAPTTQMIIAHAENPNQACLHTIAEHFSCLLENIPFIGDSYKDIQAANAAGAKTYFS